MKFDVIRAWKDENYRQSLSEEQLPAHPAGQLTESELELVSGCGGSEIGPGGSGGGGGIGGGGIGGGVGGGGIPGLGVSSANSSSSRSFSFFQDNHWHSVAAAACETNTFSAAQTVTPATPLLSPTTVICAQRS